MTTIIATIVVLGILVFVHEFGHFLLETEYRLSVIPLGGYVKLLGENPEDEVPPELQDRAFSHHPLWHRTLIVLAGPGFNLLFCVVALFFLFSLWGIPYLTTKIGSVKADSPAAHAGLQVGDQVLAVDGQPVARWEDLAARIRRHGEQPLVLTVRRQGQILKITLTPKRMEATNIFGQKVSAVLIGVASSEKLGMEQVGFLGAAAESFSYTYRILALTVVSIYKLIVQEIPVNTLGGPILIAQVAGQQAEQGLRYLIHFMAILSVKPASRPNRGCAT